MKSIAVLVAVYNEQEFIRAALRSVLQQTRVDLISEIIVVDDGSEDSTPEVINDFVESHDLVRGIRQRNQGLAAARNTGLRHTTSEWVCFLDADDEWRSNKLQRQWAAASAQRDVSLWYTDTQRFGDERRRVRARELPMDRRDALIQYVRRDCPIIPSTVLARREVFAELGGFDTELKYAQDTEMWARIIANYPVERIPEPLVFRRVHSTSHSSDFFEKLRYRRLVSRKLVERYPFLDEHVSYRDARLQYSAAKRHLEEGARRRALVQVRRALSSYPLLFEAYVALLCAVLVPRPDLVLDWGGRLRRWLRDLWSGSGDRKRSQRHEE